MATCRNAEYIYPADKAWVDLLEEVIRHGHQAQARGTVFREIIAGSAVVDMQMPIVSNKGRKLGYKFLAAEAAWIISGDNRVETIWPYAKDIANFSDDGLYFAGAYGPMITAQLPYIVRTLNADPGTRQAVLTIWKPAPGPSKDIPCTVAVQFLYRGSDLHCIYTMRSSDLWLGVPYDWFNFSMLTAYVLLSLRTMNPSFWSKVQLGALFYTAGSCHIYERDQSQALGCWQTETNLHGPIRPFRVDHFNKPGELLDHLWLLAKGHAPEHSPLYELQEWKRGA